MQLTPRYDDPDLLRIDLSAFDAVGALVRQRRRLADTVAAFDADAWAAPSRCDGWNAKDVLAHLVGVNQFWAISITASRAGEPSRWLTGFDPVATPASQVAATADFPPEKVLRKFRETNEQVEAALDGVSDEELAALAEAPVGHVPLYAVVLHGLWDAWNHERDILLPQGLDAVEDPDEIALTLRYAAALGPMFTFGADTSVTGELLVDLTDATPFVVTVDGGIRVHDAPNTDRNADPNADSAAGDGALRLTGTALELAEALSRRAPLATPVDDHADAWLVSGLATVFDQV